MNIAIDGYEANVAQRLGSSQIAFELLRSFEKIDRKNNYLIFLPDKPLDDLPKERNGWKYKILKPKRLWTRIALPLALFTAGKKPDIFFSPSHYLPRFAPSKIKKIAVFFDLAFLHFPQMFTKKDLWQLTNWTKFSAKNADHLITISDFSKQDILKQYSLPKDKVTTAYPGYDKDSFSPKNRSAKDNKETYIIYIGTIQPRKNLIRLMEAFAKADIKDLKLFIAGKTSGEGRGGWMYEDILKTPKEMGIEERVKFLGFVPKDKLPQLLADALFYIQPSLWEGFGIPVLEAMASGVPVIVSNISSLPEVVGEAGILVDPYSVEQIEQAIRVMATDRTLRQKYAKAALVQAKKFSWDNMAKTVLRVFEKTALKLV